MTQHIEKRICTAVRMADGTATFLKLNINSKYLKQTSYEDSPDTRWKPVDAASR